MNNDDTIEVERLRTELTAARLTIGELRAELRGDSIDANSWLQRKVKAQAKALTRLNERVANQRFTLRAIDELGRSLSPSELASARERENSTVHAA